MGANSEIGWTTHTFNAWTGCTKVSPGCQFCYAERLSNRDMGVIGRWGPKGTRKVTADSYWAQPARWNRWAQEGICLECKGKGSVKRKSLEAVTADNPKGLVEEVCIPCGGLGKGAPRRDTVFCASLADVFEGQETMPETEWDAIDRARARLLCTIFTTEHLFWLLLTKRPENILPILLGLRDNLLQGDHLGLDPFWAGFVAGKIDRWLSGMPPENIGIGTSCEDQATADRRVPEILKVPAMLRFLSCEPLLGAIDLRKVPVLYTYKAQIRWVIVGGESGPHARPMHPDWPRSLRDQCEESRVPLFFKQWGETLPNSQAESYSSNWVNKEYRQNAVGWIVGKKAAGRLLDGREWNEFPKVLSCVQSVG